jgi:3-keto-L-gulonate-6-phosphate decarboxylase
VGDILNLQRVLEVVAGGILSQMKAVEEDNQIQKVLEAAEVDSLNQMEVVVVDNPIQKAVVVEGSLSQMVELHLDIDYRMAKNRDDSYYRLSLLKHSRKVSLTFGYMIMRLKFH